MSAAAIVALSADLTLELDPQDVLLLGGGAAHEPMELALCRERIEAGDNVVDIGAHIGYYTVWLSRMVGPRGSVCAFEPDPFNFGLLERNVARNRCDNVEVRRAACGNAAGTIELHHCEFNSGMHRVYPSAVTQGQSAPVPLVRAADVVAPGVRFVKIDVEGFEVPALQGLQPALAGEGRLTVLAEFSPLASIEAGSRPEDLLDWGIALGLAPQVLEADRWRAIAPRELKEACRCLDSAAVRHLLASIRGRSKEVLYEAVMSFLGRTGYARPYFESLALVRS